MKFPLFLGFVLGSFLVVASDYIFNSTLDEEWENWKVKFNKQYSQDEETNRRTIWENALKFIEQHNREYAMGKHTYTVAMNQFGDLTNDEFNRLMNGFLMNEADNSTEEEDDEEFDDEEEDDEEFDDEEEDDVGRQRSIDWRKFGLVTPVKNQANCGSCWAFSAVGALEGQWKKSKGQLISMSEQNVLDCDKRSYGCQGGFMCSAFSTIRKLGGINSEQTYPYTAMKGDCRFRRDKVVAFLSEYKFFKGSERGLKRRVKRIGPLSVATDASRPTFQYYHGGVYDDRQCSSRNVNHAMLLIGYGRERGRKYWLIKNRDRHAITSTTTECEWEGQHLPISAKWPF
ncbi:cathepsin K-like isoform X2 [Narcine bancroftii]|uniref:cathepsin K-like isoform X2 n=1 Tax=Narcine bancroftii TaxID=1343680 RepID=UPI003831FDFC